MTSRQWNLVSIIGWAWFTAGIAAVAVWGILFSDTSSDAEKAVVSVVVLVLSFLGMAAGYVGSVMSKRAERREAIAEAVHLDPEDIRLDAMRPDAAQPIPTSPAPGPTPELGQIPRSRYPWRRILSWTIPVILIGGVALRVIVSDAASGSGAWEGVLVIVAGLALAVILILATIWLPARVRLSRLRELAPNALLIGTLRSNALESGIAALDPRTAGGAASRMVWAFDVAGATLWKGVADPRPWLRIAREQVKSVGIGADITEGRWTRTWSTVVLHASAADGGDVALSFMVWQLERSWTLARAEVVHRLAQVLADLWQVPLLTASIDLAG